MNKWDDNPLGEMHAFPGRYVDTWEEALFIARNRYHQGSKQVVRVVGPSTRTSHRTRYIVRPYNGTAEIRTRAYQALRRMGHDRETAGRMSMKFGISA